MIYFDNAATTYPKPESVYKALDFANRNLSFNAGRGSYRKAKEGIEILNELRESLASFADAETKNVAILSSATEALNLIIGGLDLNENSSVYISPFEHNAIVRPLHNLQKKIGFKIHILPFNKKTWKPEVNKINDMFALNNPTAVFVSQISNVTGLNIDYKSIFSISKNYNSTNILDASQGFGVVRVSKSYIDFIVFAGHKSLYGPFGIAGFINLSDKELSVVKSGGNGSDTLNPEMPANNHERYESGSPNVPAAYALIKSIQWLKENDVFNHELKLTKYAIDRLSELEKVNLFLPDEKDNIIGIISFSVDGYNADEVGQILNDEFDIMIRTGYHCSPLVHDFISSTNTGGTARISFSYFNSVEEIDSLIEALTTF